MNGKTKRADSGSGREKGMMIDWKYGAVDGSFLVKVAVKMSAMAIKARILLHSITDAMVCQ